VLTTAKAIPGITRMNHDNRGSEEGGGKGMAIRVRPLHDYILVKRFEEKEVKKGSIIIPDTAKEKPQEGEVMAIGPGKLTDEGKRLPIDVKVGDKILFGKYSGNEIRIEDQEYLIMRESEVLGILK
jgi:chaperonin GroES